MPRDSASPARRYIIHDNAFLQNKQSFRYT